MRFMSQSRIFFSSSEYIRIIPNTRPSNEYKATDQLSASCATLMATVDSLFFRFSLIRGLHAFPRSCVSACDYNINRSPYFPYQFCVDRDSTFRRCWREWVKKQRNHVDSTLYLATRNSSIIPKKLSDLVIVLRN